MSVHRTDVSSPPQFLGGSDVELVPIGSRLNVPMAESFAVRARERQ
jgi:hypothetical protein